MKDIREELKNNQFLNLILNSIGIGIFILDTRGRIIAWNPVMQKITGYTFKDVKGKSCKILNFSQCFDRECPAGMDDCGIITRGNVEPRECLLSHKNGHLLSVTKNAQVIKNEKNNTIGIIESVTDLTEIKKARLKMEEAARRLGELNRLGGIIARSNVMQNVFTFIKVSAASDATILIQGESGTGKELVANAIHSIGERRDRPLVTINCSALSESLLESELFGHVKGAFTGASRDRTGRFEQADGGTIFLDEIGEISPYIQVKLLRVLQQKEIERVGESRNRKVDIRIITATNKDLKTLVTSGKFREDLYYRLKVFPIYLPPLRERKEDIPLLVNHFIKKNNMKLKNKVKGIDKAALKTLIDHSWPGNVRELTNAIEHAFVLCSGRRIYESDLPVEIIEDLEKKKRAEPAFVSKNNLVENSPVLIKNRFKGPSAERLKPVEKENLSREKLTDLLDRCGWNKAEVARRTGFSRAAIWKYMKKWDIPMQPLAGGKDP